MNGGKYQLLWIPIAKGRHELLSRRNEGGRRMYRSGANQYLSIRYVAYVEKIHYPSPAGIPREQAVETYNF